MSSTVTQTLQIATPAQWAAAQLAYMGLPETSSNIDFLVGWYGREGGNWNNTAYYNPLNTTLPMAGSSPMNSVGVQAYTSWGQGLQATAQTLSGYPSILKALASGDASGYDQTGALGSDLLKWSHGGYNEVTPSAAGGTVTLTSSWWDKLKQWGSSVGSHGFGPTVTNPIPGAISAGGTVNDLVSALLKKETWIRVAEVVGGAVVVVVGLVLMGRAIGATGIVAPLANAAGMIPGVGGVVTRAAGTGSQTATAKASVQRARIAEEGKLQRQQEAAAERRYRASQRPTSEEGPANRRRLNVRTDRQGRPVVHRRAGRLVNSAGEEMFPA